MLTSTPTDLIDLVASRYPALGRPVALTPLAFGFPVSNRLFQYKATEGRFILKAMTHPQALYGQAGVVERLEVLGQATRELRAGGLPVEAILPGQDGRFVQQHDGHLLRLYRFDDGRAFADPVLDVQRSARSLRRFHLQGLSCLSASTRKDLSRYTMAYPLHSTAAELPVLRQFVEERAGASPSFADILDQWDLIDWAVERALAHRSRIEEPACLVHADFHPRNALFSDDRDEATMIDLDNMMIGGRLMCLGFSILRFAFFQRERTSQAFDAAIATFAAEECGASGFLRDLAHAMVSLEIAKILRILHRVRTTGEYARFIDNIGPLHLANLRFLRAGYV